jgi:hypothetical protein
VPLHEVKAANHQQQQHTDGAEIKAAGAWGASLNFTHCECTYVASSMQPTACITRGVSVQRISAAGWSHIMVTRGQYQPSFESTRQTLNDPVWQAATAVNWFIGCSLAGNTMSITCQVSAWIGNSLPTPEHGNWHSSRYFTAPPQSCAPHNGPTDCQTVPPVPTVAPLPFAEVSSPWCAHKA